MGAERRVFLDTSALFAGIWSAQGGARMILKLGEAGAAQLVVGPQVLSEIDDVIRRKAPQRLPDLAALLDRCRTETAPTPSGQIVRRCQALVSHPGDALVLAEAWGAGVDFFVTFDREHFLQVAVLSAVLPFNTGTPGDCLTWLRTGLLDLME